MNARVLHIINGEFYAGAERVQDLLATRLPQFGYQCDFVCLKKGMFDEMRTCRSSTVRVVEMRSWLDWKPAAAIKSILIDGAYDLIHTHTVRSALMGRRAAMATRLPLVHHVHSPTRRDTDSRCRNRLNAFAEETLVFPFAERLIACSDSIRDYLVEVGVASGRISVVPNGVPVSGGPPVWRLPEHEWTVGAVALFRPRKGLEVLLRAIARLRTDGVPVRLRVVGGFETTDYERGIRALEQSLGLTGAVDWVGFTRNVPSEIARFSIFALPSQAGEGLPMVLLEAMAAGLPVVATNVEGVAQVVDGPGTGVLVAPNDELALAGGIASIIRLGAAAGGLAQAAWARQRSHFSDLAMARGVGEIYDAALAGRRGSRVLLTHEAHR